MLHYSRISRSLLATLLLLLVLLAFITLIQASVPVAKETSTDSPQLLNPSRRFHFDRNFWRRQIFGETDDYANEERISQIAKKLDVLAGTLFAEEGKLLELKNKRDSLKTFLWFFDAEARKNVSKIQKEINNEVRIIESTAEEIELEWDNLKPLYGLFSWMFAIEALWPVLYLYELLNEMFWNLVGLGVILGLVLWPMGGVFWLLWSSVGTSLMPFAITLGLVAVDVYMILQLPFIMIKYDPPVVQFVLVYLGIVSAALLFTAGVAKFFYPDIKLKLKVH